MGAFTSASEVQKIVDDALEGEGMGTPAPIPDRDKWGSTPEDIAAQQRMEQQAARLMNRRASKPR